MDVVISGATGLIGAALWTSLRADGHRVLRLRRGGVTDGDEIGWDPTPGRIDAPALEGVDAVVHLAGESIGEQRWTDELPSGATAADRVEYFFRVTTEGMCLMAPRTVSTKEIESQALSGP